MANIVTKAWRGLIDFGLLIRFSALGGTVILPLLGAATASRQLAGSQVSGLIGVAVAFHVFAYVLNDVVDLPTDRTEPRRAVFPLVRGTVRPWQALAFALLQVPLALALTAWLGGGGPAYAALGAGFALMAAYDAWGKRAPFPPLTDGVQGLAWGALVLYGATVVPGRPTSLTVVAVAFVVVFIVMANGVHGSLRDLANDLDCGVRSTAIMMGVRPQGATGLLIPRRLTWYAITLQVILIGITLWPLARNDFGYGPVAWGITLAAVLGLAVLSLRLLWTAASSAGDRQDMIAAGMLHLLVSLGSLVALFAPHVDGRVLAVLLGVYLAPLLTHSWLYDALRWAWRLRRAGALRGFLDDLALGLQLLIATARNRRRYPLATQAFRSAFTRVSASVRFGDLKPFLVVTRAQIDQFLAHGWGYTERRLQLLQQASDFPISGDGAEMLVDLRQRMEQVRQGPFEQVSNAIYRDSLYPVFQHVGQAFRNQVTGRQPFVLAVLSDMDPPPRRVCDVGCGAGILLGDVLEVYTHASGLGVDISHRMLGHAGHVLQAWRLDGRATLTNSDLRRLPFASGTFDFVMAMEVLEHVPNPLSGMGELARIVAPGGYLVTSIPVRDPAPTHLHVFDSVAEVLDMHRSAGLTVERRQVIEVAPEVPNVMVAARRGSGCPA